MPGIVDLRIQQPFDQPKLRRRRRPHQGAAGRPHAARRRQQPADLAERQLPDRAELLAEPEERRQLQRRHADAAVPASIRSQELAQHSGHRRERRDSPQILGNLATISRGSRARPCVSHYNVQPVIDIYGAVQGRDLGGVARRRRRGSSTPAARSCRRARSSIVRGQVETMQSSFSGLLVGLVVRDRAGLSADRGELPVLARSVHHHHGAAGGAGRHRLDAVRHRTPRSACRR